MEEEKKEHRGKKVNDRINQVVAKDIEPSKIVIDGETETCNGPVKGMRLPAVREQCLLYARPRELAEVKIGIFPDVWYIVKMEGTVEGIAVCCKNDYG